jgi:hypothetical protein
VVVSKPRAMSYELTSSQSSPLIAQNSVEKKNLIRKKPLPIPAVAVYEPRTTSCELTCSQLSSLIAQNSHEKIKFYKQKTIVGIGSGYEQAQGHEL